MYTNYNSTFLKLALILLIVASSAFLTTSCPIGIFSTLNTLEKNFVANQHQILRGIFQFEAQDFQLNDQVRPDIKSFKVTYEETFSLDRFKVKGLPNSTISVQIRNLPLRFQTIQDDSAIDNSKASQKSIRQIDQPLQYEAVVLDIQIYKESGNPKARLVNVQLNVSKQSENQLSTKMGSKNTLQSLNDVVKARLFGLKNFTAQQWWDVIPYGTQLQLGQLYKLLKAGQLSIRESDFTLCISPISDSLETFTHVDTKTAPQSGDRTWNGKEFSQFKVVLNQGKINEQLLMLHELDQEWSIPLESSQTEAAIEALKAEVEPFREASHFKLSAFFNKQVFEQHWDMDDVPQSHVQFTHDANVTLRLNVGLYVHVYDHDSNLMNTLTVLIQLGAKLQLQDPSRLTYTSQKKRPWLKIHSIFTDEVEVYDQDGELLDHESMVIIVGLKRAVRAVLPIFEEQILKKALVNIRLYAYLGDMYLEQPRDQLGIHWARLHVEGVDNKNLTFVANLETEDEMVDPERFDSSYKYYFKPRSEKVKEHTAKAIDYFGNRTSGDSCLSHLMMVTVDDFLGQWCKEEVEANNLDEEAFDRCMAAWCEIHTIAQLDDKFDHLIEINGKIFSYRQLAAFLLQIVLAIVLYVAIKCIRRSSLKGK